MKLIDADALPYENQVLSYDDEWCLKVSDIEKAPTVDAVPVWIVHRKDGIYDVYKGNRDNWVIARLSADNIFVWLAEQNLVDIRFVDEEIPNCGAGFPFLHVRKVLFEEGRIKAKACPFCGRELKDD